MRILDLHHRERDLHRGRGAKAPHNLRDGGKGLGIAGREIVPALLITGPGGVGKTTVAFEVCRQLESAGISHAMIDTDELDRIYPAPADDPHKTDLTRKNLAAVWSNLRAGGASRLVLTMVAESLEDELPWVHSAIPEAEITVVRLLASEEALLERIQRREVGGGMEDQARKSIRRMHVMENEPFDDRLVVETTGRSVGQVAKEILECAGWLNQKPKSELPPDTADSSGGG